MCVKQIWTGKAVDLAAMYGEQAPTAAVCCNACRTCITTNLLGLATAVAAAVGVSGASSTNTESAQWINAVAKDLMENRGKSIVIAGASGAPSTLAITVTGAIGPVAPSG